MDATIDKSTTTPKPDQQQVKELWDYTRREAAIQNQRSQARQKAMQKTMRVREHIWFILLDVKLTDEEALKQIRQLLD